MKYDPAKHHRHSIRLKGYDYATPGAYFVTICAQNRECLFGEIGAEGEMRLNDAGRMVEKWWLELNHKFPNVDTDEYVVMPNHFHGIVVIVPPDDNVGADLRVGPNMRVGPGVGPDAGTHVGPNPGAHTGAPLAGASLPTVIQWFKTMTTNEYIREVKTLGWPPFPGKLWQRNYWERIVRNEAALEHIRQYIVNNPARWTLDQANPQRRSA